jgi:hypothetical protein
MAFLVFSGMFIYHCSRSGGSRIRTICPPPRLCLICLNSFLEMGFICSPFSFISRRHSAINPLAMKCFLYRLSKGGNRYTYTACLIAYPPQACCSHTNTPHTSWKGAFCQKTSPNLCPSRLNTPSCVLYTFYATPLSSQR